MLLNVYDFNETQRSEARNVLMGRKLNYIYACTVKLYGILNVKNTFVMAGYWDTEGTICILLF